MMTFNGSFNHSFNSSITNHSHPDMHPTSDLFTWYIVSSVIIAISCLLGIPANIAVIEILRHHLRGSNISKRLFFSLAVSDLLCLLCLPVAVVIFRYEPHLSLEVCRLLFYIFCFCISSDLNILVMISIQRYYQILHPEKWHELHRRWQRLLLSSVWLFGALVALPVVFPDVVIVEKTDKDQNGNLYCKNPRIAPQLEAVYILLIVLSHLVLLSFYMLLVKGVKKRQMRDKKKPIVRVYQFFIRIIAVSLLVGFLPLCLRVLYVVALLTKSEKMLQLSKKLTFVECFYFFTHCLNPFLYFFFSKRDKRKNKTKKDFLYVSE